MIIVVMKIMKEIIMMHEKNKTLIIKPLIKKI